jgi:4-hydroxy-tetrahydrodipicolinate reductase
VKLLVVGRGRMGRLVESLASEHGFEVIAALDGDSNRHGLGVVAFDRGRVDVAIDFSTAEATLASAPVLARNGVALVIGTTGWHDREAEVRRAVAQHGGAAVVAANFSLGAHVLAAVSAEAARLLAGRGDFGAWLHEAHHAAKRDAPSGTARMLLAALARGGHTGPVDVSYTRAGSIPGMHRVGFDGPAESVLLQHDVRDRAAFAYGALAAARWVPGRTGWFSMEDVLGLGRCDAEPGTPVAGGTT